MDDPCSTPATGRKIPSVHYPFNQVSIGAELEDAGNKACRLWDSIGHSAVTRSSIQLAECILNINPHKHWMWPQLGSPSGRHEKLSASTAFDAILGLAHRCFDPGFLHIRSRCKG